MQATRAEQNCAGILLTAYPGKVVMSVMLPLYLGAHVWHISKQLREFCPTITYVDDLRGLR